MKSSYIILGKYLIVSGVYPASNNTISSSYFPLFPKCCTSLLVWLKAAAYLYPTHRFVETCLCLLLFPFILPDLAGKFREEFKAAFSCCCLGVHHRQEDRLTRGRTSTESRKSLTTQISNFDNISKLSEQVVLTSISTLPTANGAGPLQNW